MEEKIFRKISNMLEETIEAYEELLNLYKEKKQALLKPDREMLRFVDEKILAHVNTIKGINKKREDYCIENDIAPAKINNLIEIASKEHPEFENIYQEQKVKINEVAKELALIEKTNVELIKHGLIMSDKLLDIIISAAQPQKDNYDMYGKNADTSEISISSIVEEA